MDLKTGLPRNGGGYKKNGSKSTQNTAVSGKGEFPIVEVICCEKHKMLFLCGNLKDNFPKCNNVLLLF